MNRFNLMLEKYNFEIMEKDQIAKEIIQGNISTKYKYLLDYKDDKLVISKM